MSRSILELENFVENPKLHLKFGYHVQVFSLIFSIMLLYCFKILYYGLAIIMVVIDLFAILFGIIFFSYPQKHRELPIYRQLFQVNILY